IRFFASPAEQDKSGNTPAGMVVDQEIRDPHLFDFFCTQYLQGLEGTNDLQELVNSGK
ncbi:hypothetical protein DFH28DRAFT_890100, partial [Melampsora americana]